MHVAIASGKGGTGKTLLATNLAHCLSQENESVQILDCDVEEPNSHLFLPVAFSESASVETVVPDIEEQKCTGCGLCAERCAYNALGVVNGRVLVFSELCHSCGGCMLFCPADAIREGSRKVGQVDVGYLENIELVRGTLEIGSPLAPEVIHAVRSRARKNSDVLIDAPPGTSCAAVAAIAGVDFCVLVTEPTPYGLNDLKLAVGMARRLKVPVGVVINRADMGDNEVELYCIEENIPVLLKIPFSRDIAVAYARGELALAAAPHLYAKLLQLWADIERRVGCA